MTNFLSRLNEFKVIPVLVIEDISIVTELGDIFVNSGLPVVEVTLRTPTSWQAVEKFLGNKNLAVGVGSVSDEGELLRAKEIGAEFVVSAGFNLDLVNYANQLEMNYLPGISNPSEILMAKRAKLDVVKYFPAESLGGVKTLQAMSAPFPDMKFVPTGGITFENMHDYLKVKNVVAVGGSWMVSKKLLASRDLAGIGSEIVKIVEAMKIAGD